MAQNSNNSRSNSGSPVAVGIIAFLLGFLFAFIVLFGSIFGVGYVAATTDINEVFRVFGLENENKDYNADDPNSEKYNYINADQAPNIYTLITEIVKMANDGLGEININRIDALAPITNTVLDMGYEYIDEVVDFDKEYFEDVPLTSIIDVVKNSLYYVHTAKIIETLNEKMGYSISLEEIPVVGYMVDGVEANYATVKGKDENFRLPVLYDYYVNDGSAIEYSRTVADPDGISAYPANFNGDYSFIHETTLKNADGEKLYRVYYVPCKVTETGIEEADYQVKKIEQEDPNVTFTKDGETVKLKYVFRTVEFGEDTDFIAVKSVLVDGIETFTLDYDEIIKTKNSDSAATASNRYIGYSYYDSYARNYYTGPSAREENNLIYGVSTVNNINFFKNVAGEVVEYDPLLVSDIMLDALHTLDQVPVATVVNADQAEVVRGIFGDTPLGDILGQRVDFNELVNNIELATFLDEVKPDDKVMTYLVYNLTDVKDDGAGNYTAVYDKDGANIAVNVKVEGGIIKGVENAQSGEEIKGNTVEDMSTLTDGLTIDVFMDVKADDAIMTYIGYGVTDVYKVSGKEYGYAGSLDGSEVHIYTDAEGKISKVVDLNGVEIDGTKIDGVSDRVNGITDALSLPDFIDVDPEEAILSYIGYGIYDIEKANGADYNYIGTYSVNGTEYTAYISAEVKDGKNVVTSAWYEGPDSQRVNIFGTKISGVSDRLDNITNVLAITEFIDIKASDSIMAYVGYGVSKVNKASGTDSLGNSYDYTCEYPVETGVKACYITANADGNATEVWYVENGEKHIVKGTKIGQIPDRISGLQDTLTIGELVEVNASSPMILQALKDTTVNGLENRINELKVSDVISEEQINNNTVLPQLKNTLIVDVGNAIDEVLIQRIYADSIYGVPENSNPVEVTDATFNPQYLYYEMDADGAFVPTKVNCPADKNSTEYDNMLGKLTQEQWNNRGDKKYYSYGEAKGMWKLVLYRMDGDTKTEKAYTLNNFNNMVGSCEQTVYKSTINELKEAGIITVEDATKFQKPIRVVTGTAPDLQVGYIKILSDGSIGSTPNEGEATLMGELTLEQFINAIIQYSV